MSNSPFRRMIEASPPDFWRLWYVGLIVATVRWLETIAVGVVVYQRTDLVDHVLATVRRNLIEGALLVVLVLFLFLGSIRAGLVVASIIPRSSVATRSRPEYTPSRPGPHTWISSRPSVR